MNEIQDRLFQLSFNAYLKAEFQGFRVTSYGGLILGAHTRRATRVRRIDQTPPDELSWEECAVCFADLLCHCSKPPGGLFVER